MSLAAAQPSSLSLDDLMSRLAAAPQRRASFAEDKRVAALELPLHSAGTLAYSKPDRLEKITTTPTPERLVVDGTRLTMTAGDDAPHVFDLAGQPAALALIDTIRGILSGNLALLRRTYDVTQAGNLSAWQLVLQPREPALRRLVREVRIAGAGAEVRSIDTLQANGDADHLTITSLP